MIESIWSPANFRFGTLIFRNSRQCDNRFSIVSRVSGRRCAGWELPRTIDREAPPLRSLSVFIS